MNKQFTNHAKENIVIQIIGGIFFSLIMDAGYMSFLWLVSCVVYWIGFLFIRYRKPDTLSRSNELFLYYGTFIAFATIFVIESFVTLLLI